MILQRTRRGEESRIDPIVSRHVEARHLRVWMKWRIGNARTIKTEGVHIKR